MGGKCLNEVIDLTLRKIFYRHGKLVGNHPGYFIVVPILLTVLCFTGVQRMDYNYDPEYLFSPTNIAVTYVYIVTSSSSTIF